MDDTATHANTPEPDTRVERENDAPSVLDEAGQALFRLGRMFSRQPMRQRVTEHSKRALELSRILVVQAVEAGVAEPGEEVTVGVVAKWLDVDPSTASRLVSETIRAGYLSGTASPADARRTRLALTDAGHALAAAAQRYQRAAFEHITREWPERERQEFARLFIKFADAVTESRASQIVAAPRVRD